MKEEALVMTIDFGKNHFNAIYLNNQLRLISSDGCMITINDPQVKGHKERRAYQRICLIFLSTDLLDGENFYKLSISATVECG